jgi:hypothetical protein
MIVTAISPTGVESLKNLGLSVLSPLKVGTETDSIQVKYIMNTLLQVTIMFFKNYKFSLLFTHKKVYF